MRKTRIWNADKREFDPPRCYQRGAHPVGDAPSTGVPPRHLRQRPNATAQLQFARFLRWPTQAHDPEKWSSGFRTRSCARHCMIPKSGLPVFGTDHARLKQAAWALPRPFHRRAVQRQAGRNHCKLATQARSGRSAGRALYPKPPGSAGDEPAPAGTALAPPPGVARSASFYQGEIHGGTVP